MRKCTAALAVLAAVSLLVLPPMVLAQKRGATPQPAPVPPGGPVTPGPCLTGCWHAAATKGKADIGHRGDSALFSEAPGGRSAAISMHGEGGVFINLARAGAGLPAPGKYELANACPDHKAEPPKGSFIVQYSPRFDPGPGGTATSRGGTIVIEFSTGTRVTGHYSVVLCYMDGTAGTLEGTFDARNPMAGM